MSERSGHIKVLRLISNPSEVIQTIDIGPRSAVRYEADYVLISPIRLLLHADGTWSFEHICKEWHEDGDLVVKVVAPRLGELHRVKQGDADGLAPGQVEVEPSIMCPDCGLHGFIRSSEWWLA